MSDITITLVLKPSSELMLLGDALIQRLDKILEYRGAGGAEVARDDVEPTREATKARDEQPEPPQPDAPRPAASIVRLPAASSPATPVHWATEERKDVLRQMFPTAAPPGEILRALGAADGPMLPRWETIYTYAYSMKLRRPSATASKPKQAPAVEIRAASDRFARAFTAPTQPIDTTTPIVTDLTTIRAKAATWGITHQSDDELIAAVNDKARRVGHRPFVVEGRAAG